MYDARPSFRSSSNRKPLSGCACIRSHKHTSRARSTHTIGRSDKLSENHYSFLRMEIASSSQKTSPACVFLFNAVDPSPPERHSQAQRARRTPRKTDTVIWKKTAFKSGLHHMSWIKRLMLLYLLLFWQPVPFYRLRLPFWLWIHEPWISVWSSAVKSFFPCAYTDTSFSDNLSGLHWIFSFQCWTPWIALRPEATSDLG